MKEIRKLRANEIECRVGAINEKGFSILLYKDARVDMNILDETFGNMNWQREHKEIKGNLYCGVSIWDDEKNQWITKWDCGVESFSEKEKGESSDSFKRACFCVGIGRELYTAPFIWIKGNVKEKNGKYVPTINNMSVKYIGYNENREIAHLMITGDGKTIFGYNEPKTFNNDDVDISDSEDKKNFTQKEIQEEIQNESIVEITLEEAENAKTPKGTRLGDLTYDQLQVIIENDKYTPYLRDCAKLVSKSLDTFVRDENGDILF